MSTELINRRVVLSSRPRGVPQAQHFTVEEIPVPELKDGEFLVKTEYWSIDPAMRGWVNVAPNYLPPVEIGAPMRSFAVGEIVASRSASYERGDRVIGVLGWQRYAIDDGSNVDRKISKDNLPVSLHLGVLGLNGMTAYFGLQDVCQASKGDTVVVSTAAGSVGSAVGQIAKIKGCRTVGITSSAEKMAMCKEVFGYDDMINYREEDVALAIKTKCPDGVDCYFDNTCGPISDAVMTNLAVGARIAICGTASLADWDPIPVGPRVHRQLLVARARLQGFLILDYRDRYQEAVSNLHDWVISGDLTHSEHVLEGIAEAPAAISMLYQGQNNGKLLVRVD